jgi:methylenetetrahydrofolate--tRNA-(uracil-5-)-methyltransferase
MKVTVIGGGLAGCEAALQLADRGVAVELVESKPIVMSPAHHSTDLAEVVCSNSFKSNDVNSASGLLKEELRRLNCKLIAVADKCAVNAGGALAVDREKFSAAVTQLIKSHPNITVRYTEADGFFEGVNIVATGPLTSDKMLDTLKIHCGNLLYFFDAAAPIVSADSIDIEKAFISDRYQKGTGDYINCPLNQEEFKEFWQQLINAKTATVKDFEKNAVFESCMPIEVMASRGEDTIRFGPLKPVGLFDPKTGKRPYAVVQLRKENAKGDMYNMVGFQTHLTFGEQERVFRLIPALQNAEFLRYGVMHKNIFINSPSLLDNAFALKTNPNIFFAGQITGVEGYVESIASGLVTALNCFRRQKNLTDIHLGDNTIIGCLCRYITTPNLNFQPMNANLGLLPPLAENIRDKQKKKEMYANRSLKEIEDINRIGV